MLDFSQLLLSEEHHIGKVRGQKGSVSPDGSQQALGQSTAACPQEARQQHWVFFQYISSHFQSTVQKEHEGRKRQWGRTQGSCGYIRVTSCMQISFEKIS